MTHAEPELTRHERELLADPGEGRGYVPADGIAEPARGPTEPASASPPRTDDQHAAKPPD